MKQRHLTIIALAGSLSAAHAVTIASSTFDTAGTQGTGLTWVTDTGVTMNNSGDLAFINSAFTVLGGNSTVNDISNSQNLNNDSANGFSFAFTTTSAYDLTNLTIDTGHLNNTGGDQAFASDLDITFTGINGTVYSLTVSENDINYASGSPRLPQNIDLSGNTLAAGEYEVSITMQEGTANISGAFTSFDNVALNGDVVPEPSSTALIGLAGLGFILRRRR